MRRRARDRLIVADARAELPEDVGGAEVIRIVADATPGVLLAIALRRASTGLVVVGEGWPAEATADRIPELLALLDDPAVGVAGWWGLVSSDLRHLSAADATTGDPVAVAWAGMACRTGDGLERGPVDEGFSDSGMLAAWWSLVLRDEGEESPPRAARALLDATNSGLSHAPPGARRAPRPLSDHRPVRPTL